MESFDTENQFLDIKKKMEDKKETQGKHLHSLTIQKVCIPLVNLLLMNNTQLINSTEWINPLLRLPSIPAG